MESSTAELTFFLQWLDQRKERVALDFGASAHHPSETWHFQRLRLHQRLRRPSALVTDILCFDKRLFQRLSWRFQIMIECSAIRLQGQSEEAEWEEGPSESKGRAPMGFVGSICATELSHVMVSNHAEEAVQSAAVPKARRAFAIFVQERSNAGKGKSRNEHASEMKRLGKEPHYYINQCLKVELVEKSNQGNHSPPQLQTLSLLRNGEVLQKTWKRCTRRDRVKSSPHKEWPW